MGPFDDATTAVANGEEEMTEFLLDECHANLYARTAQGQVEQGVAAVARLTTVCSLCCIWLHAMTTRPCAFTSSHAFATARLPHAVHCRLHSSMPCRILPIQADLELIECPCYSTKMARSCHYKLTRKRTLRDHVSFAHTMHGDVYV